MHKKDVSKSCVQSFLKADCRLTRPPSQGEPPTRPSKPEKQGSPCFFYVARHGQKLGGESPLQTWQWEVLAKGKGIRREAESEGSQRQNIVDVRYVTSGMPNN